MFALLTLGLACSPASSKAPLTMEPMEAPPRLVEPAPESAAAPGAPEQSGQDTVFLARTRIGWIGLGCLTAAGVATQAKDCELETTVPVEIGLPGGETLPLDPTETLHCDPTGEPVRGHRPIPSAEVGPLGWHPANNTNNWLPATRSPLVPDLLPMVSAAAEKGLHERLYPSANASRLSFQEVYRGDLEHNGREDLLVEAAMPHGDEDPPPSVILLVTDTAMLLAPKGLDHTGSIELVGSWDTGTGSAVVLLQTFWAGGTGTHLVGFNAGKPTLLGQWVCGT